MFYIYCVAKPKNARYVLQPAEYKLEGYDVFTTNIDSENGRGMILYTKKILEADRHQLQTDFQENILVKIKLDKESMLVVGGIYRSPTSDTGNNAELRQLLKCFSELKASHKLLMGDFNFPKIDWEKWITEDSTSSESQQFLDRISDTYLHQHVNQPTRGRAKENPSVLDLIFTNELNMVDNIKYDSPLGRSDHSVIAFDFVANIEKATQPWTKFYYDKTDIMGMSKELQDIDWDAILDVKSMDIDELYKVFTEKILALQKKYVPSKEISGKMFKHRKPLSKNTLRTIRKKHRAWQRFLETKCGKKYQEYVRLRNKVRKLTRKASKEVEKNIADEAKSNPKRFWSYVNRKTKTRERIAELHCSDDSGITRNATTDKEKADTLAEFFTSVFTREPSGELPEFEDRSENRKLTEIKITHDMVIKKLKALNPQKTQGPDSIHPSILKNLCNELSIPLVIIFNESLLQGRLPKIWKNANVTAIYKKGDKHIPGNYRPVSLTCISCKIMEQIVRDKIVEHMKPLLSNKQFGFINGRSTILQLLHVMDDWTEIIDNGGIIDCIYMDFMKAFDQVPHNRLKKKLAAYGIKSETLNWISDFLRERNQQVIVNGSKSDVKPVYMESRKDRY